MLLNLAGNAIKFTASGFVSIDVSCVSASATQAVMRIAVCDTGIGIPVEKRALLFQQFSQLDVSTTRRFGGSGLGLSICRSLVELMDGNIALESEAGKGSKFWFDVPLGIPEAVSAILDSPQDRSSPAKVNLQRVLLAEDNLVNQKVAVALLSRLGCQCDLASNGVEAVEFSARGHYDAILMDCFMPEIDGYEATRRIRARESCASGPPRHIPIIAMTANAMRSDRERCLSAGMDDYLAKPVSVESLAAVLSRWSPAVKESAPEPALMAVPIDYR